MNMENINNTSDFYKTQPNVRTALLNTSFEDTIPTGEKCFDIPTKVCHDVY